MRIPLKLNAIDQEHLQELYDAIGVARDELPYTEPFETLWQGFQDRTFKNAERDQLYGALIKYVRSSGNAPSQPPTTPLDAEQLKHLKRLLPQRARADKVLPYSDEFDEMREEFQKQAGVELTPHEFWQSILLARGPRRAPPKRKAKVTQDDDED